MTSAVPGAERDAEGQPDRGERRQRIGQPAPARASACLLDQRFQLIRGRRLGRTGWTGDDQGAIPLAD
jgi:hypothetical protein